MESSFLQLVLTAQRPGCQVLMLRMVVLTYVLAGAMAAVSGFLLVGYTQNAGPNLGNQYLFPSIIAVAIGGTQMSGGKGSYFGTIPVQLSFN
jgi:ribose transport system permease protein